VNAFATIATYVTPQAAREAQGVLVGAGFEAMVDDTRLRVPDVDAILAGDVLERAGEWPVETEEVEELPVETGCECEVCEPILRARGPLFLFLAVVAFGLAMAFGASQGAFFAVATTGIFLVITEKWRCSECGASWR
jgi:hypothetical protein